LRRSCPSFVLYIRGEGRCVHSINNQNQYLHLKYTPKYTPFTHYTLSQPCPNVHRRLEGKHEPGCPPSDAAHLGTCICCNKEEELGRYRFDYLQRKLFVAVCKLCTLLCCGCGAKGRQNGWPVGFCSDRLDRKQADLLMCLCWEDSADGTIHWRTLGHCYKCTPLNDPSVNSDSDSIAGRSTRT
jgi:hypothetical protein